MKGIRLKKWGRKQWFFRTFSTLRGLRNLEKTFSRLKLCRESRYGVQVSTVVTEQSWHFLSALSATISGTFNFPLSTQYFKILLQKSAKDFTCDFRTINCLQKGCEIPTKFLLMNSEGEGEHVDGAFFQSLLVIQSVSCEAGQTCWTCNRAWDVYRLFSFWWLSSLSSEEREREREILYFCCKWAFAVGILSWVKHECDH